MKTDYYRSPVNLPRTGHEIVTCHYPLRIDTYSGCYHDCIYCYARAMLSDRNFWNPLNVRIADINYIKRYIERCLNGRNENNSVCNAIRKRVPARLGGLTDCFQPIERNKKVTLQLIKFLNSIDYPYLIVTKSDLISKPEYLNVLRKDLAYVQITITTLNESLSRQLEPRAPSPKKRIAALKILNENGIYVAARISPIIPNVTMGEIFQIIDLVEKMRIPHILFEFFRGTRKMVEEIEKASGVQVKPLYKSGFYYKYPLKEKFRFYESIAKRLRNSFTLFSFCSDGDPIPFDLCPVQNCCGADGIRRIIPNTKFNAGNEKVASFIYYRLKKFKKLTTKDVDDLFSVSNKEFLKFWNVGKLCNYIPRCRWCSSKNVYCYNDD